MIRKSEEALLNRPAELLEQPSIGDAGQHSDGQYQQWRRI